MSNANDDAARNAAQSDNTSLTDKNGTPVKVFSDLEQGFFGIAYEDADEVAGFTQFVTINDERVFFHTVIEEAYGGRGLASVLISQAMAETAAEDIPIVAVCPFVNKWLKTHDFDGQWRSPEMDDLRALRRTLAEK